VSTCPTSTSSASACNLLNGADGAVPSFLGHWVLRGVLIAPGLALAGVRGRPLWVGALASSTMISAFLLLYTGVTKDVTTRGLGGRRRRFRAARGHRYVATGPRVRRLRFAR